MWGALAWPLSHAETGVRPSLPPGLGTGLGCAIGGFMGSYLAEMCARNVLHLTVTAAPASPSGDEWGRAVPNGFVCVWS